MATGVGSIIGPGVSVLVSIKTPSRQACRMFAAMTVTSPASRCNGAFRVTCCQLPLIIHPSHSVRSRETLSHQLGRFELQAPQALFVGDDFDEVPHEWDVRFDRLDPV